MNIKDFFNKNKKIILLITSIFVLIGLIICLLYNRLSFIDESIYNFVIKCKSSFFTFFFTFITFFASVEWFIILCLIILFFYKNKKLKFTLIIYIIIIALITLVLKNIFVRDRPNDLMIILETGYSFPSGHSSFAMAFYGLVSYFIYKSELSKKKKIVFIALLLLLILLIGISRIYLGVHYPSDVLAGFMVGLIYFIIFIYIYDIEARRLK